MNNYLRKPEEKSADYPLFASSFKMPDIFLNKRPINSFKIEEIQKYTHILKFDKGFTKGILKNVAYYFELK